MVCCEDGGERKVTPISQGDPHEEIKQVKLILLQGAGGRISSQLLKCQEQQLGIGS